LDGWEVVELNKEPGKENGIGIILPLLKETSNTLFETLVVPTENGFIV
jgi:hypothetical protein